MSRCVHLQRRASECPLCVALAPKSKVPTYEDVCRELLEKGQEQTLMALQRAVAEEATELAASLRTMTRMTWKRREEVERTAKDYYADDITAWRAAIRQGDVGLEPWSVLGNRRAATAWAVATILENVP